MSGDNVGFNRYVLWRMTKSLWSTCRIMQIVHFSCKLRCIIKCEIYWWMRTIATAYFHSGWRDIYGDTDARWYRPCIVDATPLTMSDSKYRTQFILLLHSYPDQSPADSADRVQALCLKLLACESIDSGMWVMWLSNQSHHDFGKIVTGTLALCLWQVCHHDSCE